MVFWDLINLLVPTNLESTCLSSGEITFLHLVGVLYVCSFFLAAPCSMWDLSSRPGIEPETPALEAQSLNHWTLPWQGFQYLQNNSRIWLRILSTALEEELKVLNFVLWLNYYYFILLVFPLFLHFLTSLIKFALWNSRKTQETKAFLQTRGRGKRGSIPGKALQGPAPASGVQNSQSPMQS